MKTLSPILILITVGCMSHAGPVVIQPVPPPPPPDEDVFVIAQAPPAALPNPAVAPVPPNGAVISGGHGSSLAWAGDMPFKLSSSSSSRRTLVIPKDEASPELLANAEEDLNVMALILEKALEQRSDDEGRKALGIDVFASSSGIRNLLIEGHGAIFALKTKVALVPPPAAKKEEETKTKETTSSEWDDARRQLYGPSEIEKEIQKAFKHAQNSFSSSEEYDESKVQRLKESLTDALKSASNIRNLKDNETVTVVVLSSSSVTEVRKVTTEIRGAGRAGARADVYAKADRERDNSTARTGSRMLLKAKKSDIDAFAKGKLTSEAFREKVKIQIY